MVRGVVVVSVMSVMSVSGLRGGPTSLLDSARAQLAEWSLEDAKLRRKVQKEMRSVEIRGEPEAVDLFSRLQRYVGGILDEEEYRATQIVEGNGRLVRPSAAPADVRGPLGELELLWTTLKLEEVMDGAKRAADDWRTAFLAEYEKVLAAEEFRTTRGEALGERTRPMDAPPSILGDVEGWVDALYREESARLTANPLTTRFVDVPARSRGPLAALERKLQSFLDVVRAYEVSRIEIVRREARRPMDSDPESVAGRVEAFLAGLARGPLLFRATALRVIELFSSTVLPNEYDDDPEADAAFERAMKRGPRRGGGGGQ